MIKEHKYFIKALLLLSLLKVIFCQNTKLTISDIKKTNYTCETDSQCPKYSKLCAKRPELMNLCSFKLYCHKEGKCVYDDADLYTIPYLYINKQPPFGESTTQYANNKKKMIIESCDEDEVNKKNCKTRKCAVNEDCFSAICRNNNCITDPKNPLLVCNAKECKKFFQEKCTNDNECSSNKCENNICVYKETDDENINEKGEGNDFIWWGIGIFVLLFGIIGIVVILLYFARKKEDKKLNNNKISNIV